MRARPSIDHMLDCRVRVWRPTEADDEIGVVERTYETINVYDAFLSRPTQQDAPSDGGLAPMGGVRWYGKPSIDVKVRDVCVVISGPETHKMFEVNSPPVQPKAHHTQVDCIEWHGKLPALVPYGVAIRPNNPGPWYTNTQQTLEAVVTDFFGEEIPDADVVWSTDTPELATIDNSGFIQLGLGPFDGVVSFTVTLGSVAALVFVQIQTQPA